ANRAKQRQVCLNCTKRAPRKAEEHTCRKCGEKWCERQPPGNRKRYCFKCRVD
ncbi:unnamed protein product, partial [Durusdinium trenchii]